MIYTGRNPNVYAVLVLGSNVGDSSSKGIYEAIAETLKPIQYLDIGESAKEEIISKGITIIEGFQKEASALKRELVSMEGFGLAVHCSGSDWTSALAGNASLGAAADLVVANGGKVFMTEWMEWSGSQVLMAEKCVTRELGIELLDNMDKVRETVLRETGRTVEYMNPHPSNKEAGLTTLAEKSVGTIRKVGSTPIQGLLEFCEQPSGKGVWLPKHDSVWPPTTATYGSMSGAHISVLNTGIGWLYFELPHIPCIRMTGNPDTYKNEAFRLDFNAGIAFDGLSIPEVGEKLFDYIISVAEREKTPKAEIDKVRAFNLYYYTENEFGEKTDKGKMLPIMVEGYHDNYEKYTNNVK
jgi:altronate dehydratase large subunit